MEYTRLLGISVGVAIFSMVLRNLSKEYCSYLQVAFGLFVMWYVISSQAPYISYIRELSSEGIASQSGVILRALFVGVITCICCGICRSVGENEIAGGAELIGKCAMLTLALPLIKSIADSARALLS